MLIGILSDSHDSTSHLEAAVSIFSDAKVDHVYHAGDIESPRMLDTITKIASTFDAVFGNSDRQKTEFCKINGGRFNFHYGDLKFTLEGRTFLMTHDPENIAFHAGTEKFDCIIHGHTHQARAELIDCTLYLNPGETAWKRSAGPSVALLEVESLTVRFIPL